MEGSAEMQMVLFVCGGFLVLFHIFRGWQRGPVRQLCMVGALLAAYLVAVFASGLVAPLLHGWFDLPDFVLTLGGGLLLGIIVYVAINMMASILFRATKDQESKLVKFVYGVSGGILGAVFGVVMLWMIVMGIRLTGTVAQEQVEMSRKPLVAGAATPQPPGALALGVTKLKTSLELGVAGDVAKKVDVIPEGAYDVLLKSARVSADPEAAQRFLNYPGAKLLTSHPRITALTKDPQIVELAATRDYLAMLQNRAIIDAANDPEIRALAKNFELGAALDYALEK